MLEVSDADVICLQEHRLLGYSLPAAQDWASKAGWGVPATAALPGMGGKAKAGAALAIRNYIGSRCWPGLQQGQATLVKGRAAGATVLTFAPGGLHCISAYFKDGIGLRGENAKLMDSLEDHLQGLEGPWILGAPGAMGQEAGWNGGGP